MTTSLEDAVLSVQGELDRLMNGPLRTDAIEGREGNLLVVQVRSEIGEKQSRRSALRSLGLRSRGSVVLRSDDAPTMGNIAKVGDLVMVVRLPERCTRDKVLPRGQNSERVYEKIQYGSMTRPAELIRSRDGDYFAFESDRVGVLFMWGTTRTATDVFEECQRLSVGDLPVARNSIVVSQSRRGSPLAIAEDHPDLYLPPAAALTAVRDERQVSLARIAFSEFECAWLSPRRPFDDMDVVCAEVHFYTENLDFVAVRALAESTGPSQLLSEANVTIDMRRQGVRRLIPFMK